MSHLTKKERILGLFHKGLSDIVKIAKQVPAKPSYVAQILQAEGLIGPYFDLYTHVRKTQNVYARDFEGILSFKTPLAAKRSVYLVDKLYQQYRRKKDRAGQHEAMVIALIGMNRARWCGKVKEGAIFSNWIKSHLMEEEDKSRVVKTLSNSLSPTEGS